MTKETRELAITKGTEVIGNDKSDKERVSLLASTIRGVAISVKEIVVDIWKLR